MGSGSSAPRGWGRVGAYVRAVFFADDVLYQLRAVIAMVRHLEGFPLSRARAAARRAHYFGAFSYGACKDILRKGLDLEPLPDATPVAPAPQPPRRFARRASELVQHKLVLISGSKGDPR